ncbi:MAG: hypothetical protein H7318_07045 [Oligoflexus sp.]|nr:hypothetical protein [Oligoflexus sp.]
MALMFILHVLGIGILLNRLPIRIGTVLGTFVYFFGFYVIAGNYLASHREKITPQMPLEDDYYNNLRPKKKSFFDSPQFNKTTKEDEEATLEQERKLKLEKKNSELHPSTKP